MCGCFEILGVAGLAERVELRAVLTGLAVPVPAITATTVPDIPR